MWVSLFLCFVFISVPSATASPNQQTFLQCLLSNSQPEFPISDAIFTPNNASFSLILNSLIKNKRFQTPQTPKPVVIVTAKHESHVQTTVICAKNVGLELRIRSGGHDYEGLSYVSQKPFVILDMFNLRSIKIDLANESGWVQSGATIGELYYAIANLSKVHAFPGGICPNLGAGGHFAGGGYGNLMRKYGLSVDNIIDAQIVNVDGKILNRKEMGEDLFWAIRGGGGTSFGVILSWTIKLVSVPEKVTVFQVYRNLEENGKEIVYEWQEVADKIDENLFIRLIIQPSKGKRNEKTAKVKLVALFLGTTDKLLELVNQNIPSLKLQKQECNEMSWIESVLFWANFPNGTAPEALLIRTTSPPTIALKRKSDYVKEPISKQALESIWNAVVEIEEVGLTLNPYGGKMNNISESETPFPHRAGNKYKIQYSSNWKEDSVEESNRHINSTRRLYEAMTLYVSKNPRESFLNYRDIDVGTNAHGTVDEGKVYGAKYFKGNFDRLVSVKTKVDPKNFFTNEQSIPIL